MEKCAMYITYGSLKTVKQLVVRLNQIKLDEFGSNDHKITVKQLWHFSKVKGMQKRYRTFTIKKKSGGVRKICAPCYQLDTILHLINIWLKSIYTPNLCVTGFTQGRSVVDNAKVHTGHNYVFNIDLKDFFSSIPQARVWARLQLPPFNFSQAIANILAGLCCYYDEEKEVSILPQGAPTSPLLTNAICDKLDRRMQGVAKRFGVHYTRYADDMTFSSMHNVYHEGGDFRTEVKRIIEEQGFVINDKKTRLLRKGTRQEVTGLTVNQKVNVSRKYISDLRWLLHIWEKEGYAKAYSLFYPKYKKEKGHIKKGEPIMENVIGGKLNYLRMVKGCDDNMYKRLQTRYNKLQSVFIQSLINKRDSFVYIQPYTVTEFVEYFSTCITLEVSQRRKLIGKCTIAGIKKVLPISISTQQILCPDLAKKNQGETIISENLNDCHVVLCRAKGRNFWLITKSAIKRSKQLSVQNVNIDVDKLLSIWKGKGLEKAVLHFQHLLHTKQTIQAGCKNKLEPQQSINLTGKITTTSDDKVSFDETSIMDELDSMKQEHSKRISINYDLDRMELDDYEIQSMVDDFVDELIDEIVLDDFDNFDDFM